MILLARLLSGVLATLLFLTACGPSVDEQFNQNFRRQQCAGNPPKGSDLYEQYGCDDFE